MITIPQYLRHSAAIREALGPLHAAADRLGDSGLVLAVDTLHGVLDAANREAAATLGVAPDGGVKPS